MYKIEYTTDALEDMRVLKRFEQNLIVDEIDNQLQYDPSVETRNRKRLRPNKVAEWELRIGRFRAFYDVRETDKTVTVEAVGYKVHNKLFIHGEEYEL